MEETEVPILDMKVEESDEPYALSDDPLDDPNDDVELEPSAELGRDSADTGLLFRSPRKKATERKFKCNICGKAFLHVGHQKRHMKIHNPMPLSLVSDTSQASKTGSTPEALVIQRDCPPVTDNGLKGTVIEPVIIPVAKPSPSKVVPIPVAFLPEFSLTDHKKTISRSFVCEVCGKGFGRNSHLKRHIKLHEAEAAPLLLSKPSLALSGCSNNADSSLTTETDVVTSTVFVDTFDELKPEPPRDVDLSMHGQIKSEPLRRDSCDTHSELESTLDGSGTETSVQIEVDPPISVEESELVIPGEKSLQEDRRENDNAVNSDSQSDIETSPLEKFRKDMDLGDSTVTGSSLSEMPDANQKPDEIFECFTCFKKFGRKSHLKRHVKLHTILEYHDCEICGKRFNQGAYLRAHMKTVHAAVKTELEKIYECPVCNREFGRMSHLKRHMKLHVGGTTYDCSICGKSFLQNSNLKSHMKCHMELDTSIGEGLIKKHVNVETNEEYYECDLCGKSFALLSSLKAHINTLHIVCKELDKTFECTYCGKQFGRNSHLKRHVKLHVGGKIFMCDLCGRGFRQNGNLKAHIRMVHLKERTHKCNYCGKMFLQQSNLNTHIRTHTGEKPYECTICGRSFIQGNQLKYHMQSHLGITPFSCSLCGRAFTNNRSFKKHKNAHETKRNYSCDHCPMRFCYRNELSVHLNTVHNGRSCSMDDAKETSSSEDKTVDDGEMVVVKEELEDIVKEEPLDYASDYDSTNFSSSLSAEDVSRDNVDPLDEDQSSSEGSITHPVNDTVGNMTLGELDEDQLSSQSIVIQSVHGTITNVTQDETDEGQSSLQPDVIEEVNDTVRNMTQVEMDGDQSGSSENDIQPAIEAGSEVDHQSSSQESVIQMVNETIKSLTQGKVGNDAGEVPAGFMVSIPFSMYSEAREPSANGNSEDS